MKTENLKTKTLKTENAKSQNANLNTVSTDGYKSETDKHEIKVEKPKSNTIADMQVLNTSLMKLNFQTFDSLSSFHL